MSTIDDLDILRTQSAILEQVARDQPLQDILDALCRAIEVTMSHRGVCSIMQFDGKQLTLLAAPSADALWLQHISIVPVGKGSCGLAIAMGENIFIEDTRVAESWVGYEDLIEALNLLSCWSVPIRHPDGSLLGTFAISSSECGVPNDRQAMILESAAWLAGIAFERDRMSRENALMMSELNHRVKNNLAIVLALVKHISRRANSMDDFIDALSGRIRSMAVAHETLSESSWEDVGLSTLLTRLAGAYNSGPEHRVRIDGPDTLLDAAIAAPLGMVIHECLTNAAKHGALSVESGRVNLTWTDDDEALRLEFRESGGPRVDGSFEPGVGFDIIQGVIERQLRGSIETDASEDGFTVSVCVPIASLPA